MITNIEEPEKLREEKAILNQKKAAILTYFKSMHILKLQNIGDSHEK